MWSSLLAHAGRFGRRRHGSLWPWFAQVAPVWWEAKLWKRVGTVVYEVAMFESCSRRRGGSMRRSVPSSGGGAYLHLLAQICLGRKFTSYYHLDATQPNTPPRSPHQHTYTTMSREKRPANEAFGTSQLVKRTKSDANLGGSSAVAVVSGSGANGALIQAVCYQQGPFFGTSSNAEGCGALTGAVGFALERTAIASYGVDGPLWGGICSTIRPDWTIHSIWLHGSLYTYAQTGSALARRNVLTTYSTLAQLRVLRKLRNPHWPQAGGTRPTLVARLQSPLLRLSRHAPRKLGR